MLTSISLYCQALLSTVEIQDVRAKLMLTPEFESPKPPVTKATPESALRVCHLVALVRYAGKPRDARQITAIVGGQRPSPQPSPRGRGSLPPLRMTIHSRSH